MLSTNNWILEGLSVSGNYLDSIPIEGIVTLSRVKYGGKVSHHIQLSKPIEVYGALRAVVILDHDQIKSVRG